MKLRYIAFALMAAATLSGFAKSSKRGVSESNFQLVSQLEALEPGVTWYYNWGNVPGKGYDGISDYEGIEYVPMCWNGNYNADNIREYCKTHPNTKYLLGFNEPNFTNQANMTPEVAAAAWPAVQALAKELGLKLVAPAMNYSPNPPYTDPLKWMDEFVALVGNDAFDYVAIHNYGGLDVMKTLAGNFHNRYGKDVWVTEFCLWPNEGNSNDYVSPESQIKSMTATLEWLETTEWIFRYAWFKAVGNYDSNKGPNYGLVMKSGGSLDPWTLTPQGNVYVHMLEAADFEVWHPVEEMVGATKYVESYNLNLFDTLDPLNPLPIEISEFTNGANAAWQFEVPAAGKYNIVMNVSGYGEPTRFDPVLQWYLVEGANEKAISDTFTPEMPNSDTAYRNYATLVELPAGKVTLRLKDTIGNKPSGLRISTLGLFNEAAVEEIAVEGATEKGDIFNLQGIRVGCGEADWQSLPKGFYIVGRKIVRK